MKITRRQLRRVISEALTKTDIGEIERISRKQAKREVEKVVGKNFGKTVRDEVARALKDRATKQEIADISRSYGASVPGLRQAVFSDDYVSVVDVIRYEIGKLGLMEETNQLISLLYATAPMIEGSDLKEAVENIVDFDFAMSVVPFAYPIQRALVIKKNTMKIILKITYFFLKTIFYVKKIILI